VGAHGKSLEKLQRVQEVKEKIERLKGKLRVEEEKLVRNEGKIDNIKQNLALEKRELQKANSMPENG